MSVNITINVPKIKVKIKKSKPCPVITEIDGNPPFQNINGILNGGTE